MRGFFQEPFRNSPLNVLSIQNPQLTSLSPQVAPRSKVIRCTKSHKAAFRAILGFILQIQKERKFRKESNDEKF
jgi:hypothetical protein